MGRSTRKPARAPERHTLIVDQWVDAGMARLELDGTAMVAVPRVLLPADAAADIVLRVERDASQVTISIDEAATAAARQEGERLTARLRQRDTGGDVTL